MHAPTMACCHAQLTETSHYISYNRGKRVYFTGRWKSSSGAVMRRATIWLIRPAVVLAHMLAGPPHRTLATHYSPGGPQQTSPWRFCVRNLTTAGNDAWTRDLDAPATPEDGVDSCHAHVAGIQQWTSTKLTKSWQSWPRTSCSNRKRWCSTQHRLHTAAINATKQVHSAVNDHL